MGLPRTVLLVEDDDDLREAMAFALRRHGYEVVTAGDGSEAERLIAEQLPDLGVFDLLLPGVSGFQLTRLVKERSDGRVPVVVISGNSSAAHRDYAFACGGDAFLPKPFDSADLTAAATRHCPINRPPDGSRPFPRVAVIRS